MFEKIGLISMQEFLVNCRDLPVHADEEAYLVLASSKEEALTKYVKQVIALSALHRESVSDVSTVDGFAERFYPASQYEDEPEESEPDPELVRSRVVAFFIERPDLGASYLKYMDTEDPAFLSDDLFEFTALHLSPSELGVCAIALRSLPVIE